MSKLANLTNSEFYEKLALINQYNKRKNFINPTKFFFFIKFEIEKMVIQS